MIGIPPFSDAPDPDSFRKRARARLKLLISQLVVTGLFIFNMNRLSSNHPLVWATPLVLIVLVIINSVWFTRFVSWLIFAAAFFCLLVVLSAFTLRWRLESTFTPQPFYRTMLMYAAFVYVSLAQIKVLGGSGTEPSASHVGP